jgi:YesN/AraC family two-component response regulator
MAKPLTQKQLKAQLKKTQAMLEEKETQLASLEQTYKALTEKAPATPVTA